MELQKVEVNKASLDLDFQINPYEAILLLIYSIGGMIYFLQSLYASHLIGKAPSNFSGIIVHFLIIISFFTISLVSFKLIKNNLNLNYININSNKDFSKILSGYLIGFLSIFFGIDQILLLWGLIIIYFIPGFLTFILFMRIYEFDWLNNLKSIFDPSVDKKNYFNDQINPYEVILILIYSLGGVLYFLQSLHPPYLIGKAPYNFSGLIVHYLIIISFAILSMTSFNMLRLRFKTGKSTINYKIAFFQLLIGFLIAFLSIFIGVSINLLFWGLIIIYFIPGFFVIILFMRVFGYKLKSYSKPKVNWSKEYSNKSKMVLEPFFNNKYYDNSWTCQFCGESYEKESVFCYKCGNKLK